MRYIIFFLIVSALACEKLLETPPDLSVLDDDSGTVKPSKTLVEFDTFFTIDTITIKCNAEWVAGTEYDEPYQTWVGLLRIAGDSSKLVIHAAGSNREGRDKHAVVNIYLKERTDSVVGSIKVVHLAEPKKEIILGGEGDDRLNSLVWLPGHAIAAGYSTSSGGDLSQNRGGKDFWIIKLDDKGNKLWSRSYGGSGDDEAVAIARSFRTEGMTGFDDGFLVAGYTTSNDGDVEGNHGGKDAWLIKLDTLGNLVWQKTFGTAGDEEFTSSFDGSEDGLLFSGKKNGDQWIAMVNYSGEIVWEKTFGSASDDYAGKVFEGHYHYYFTGSGSSKDGDVPDKPTSGEDAWIVKMTSNGDIVWKNYIGGSGADRGISLTGWNGPHIVLFGNTQSTDLFPSINGTQNIFMAKFDEATGSLVSKKIIPNTGWDELTHAQELTSSNRYMLIGRSKTGNDQNSYDAFVILTDKEGEVVSSRVMGGAGFDEIRAMDFGGYDQKIYVGTSSLPDVHGNTGTGGWYGWVQQQ